MNTRKFPTSFEGIDGKTAYEKIMNRKKEVEPIQKQTTEPVSFNLDIVKSDYIQIPNQDFVIAIAETNQNLNYEEAHKATLKQGLVIPTIKQFMNFHNYFHEQYKNNKQIFDAAGNPISENTKQDLYKQLTENSWTWLNSKFNISKNKNSIEYITGLDSNDNLLTKTEDLEDCLTENCYVDFTKLTKQGLATLKSSNQNYSKAENIYFWPPIDRKVARFGANSFGAGLGCVRDSSDRLSDLGVWAVLLTN